METSSDNTAPSGRVLALDYGRVHTGAAISDPTGTIVRPLADITEAASDSGLGRIAALADSEGAALVVVGMPVTLAGERGSQAQETIEFVTRLRERLQLPVVTWDERFTSKMAAGRGGSGGASSHGRAAAVLLEDYLGSAEHRRRQEA